jgi:SAM-dependent methyltransferase
MAALKAVGMTPDDRLLDIGCGSMRLGHLAVPFLRQGHYWGTDASLDLMRHGRAVELADPDRLPASHLVQDADFAFPGIPDNITIAIAWGVFTHLPATMLPKALANLRSRLPRLHAALITVFLAPPGAGATRQRDGVVTHPDRPPYHRDEAEVAAEFRAAGFVPRLLDARLPRGQALWLAEPPQMP